MSPIIAPNPLPADIDWERVENTLGVRIVQGLQREVVDPSLVGECESDLLRSERQEVDSLGQGLDVRIRVVLEWDGSRCGGLAVGDTFQDQFSAGRQAHDSSNPSVSRTPESSGTAWSASGEPVNPVRPDRACVWCGGRYSPTDSEQLHCKKACSKNAWKLRRLGVRDCPTPEKRGFELIVDAWRVADRVGIYAYRCPCRLAHMTRNPKRKWATA